MGDNKDKPEPVTSLLPQNDKYDPMKDPAPKPGHGTTSSGDKYTHENRK